MHGLISLANNNYVDNNLKEILVYIYFGKIANSRIKKHLFIRRSIWISEWLAPLTTNDKVTVLNSTEGGIQHMTVQHFTAQSLAENSHELLSLIFSEKMKKKNVVNP